MPLAQKAQQISSKKGLAPISALTAYDFSTARLLDEAGVDILLVGDSLGMVVLGYPDTTHVTLDHMRHHIEAVSRGAGRALVVGDLPIHTYATPAEAINNAQRLVQSGAQAVKLEGGVKQAEKVRAVVEMGIPVMGHLGMLPQRVRIEGGYRKKGRTKAEADQLIEGAVALEKAGAFAIVLESIFPRAAARITKAVGIPTIGIGSGDDTCDGEIAVITDVIGSYPWFVPPFAVQRADVAGEITRAVKEYLNALAR